MSFDCRIWWPTQLLNREPAPSFLCGWFVSSSSGSVDIVVANAVPLRSSSPFVDQNDVKRLCSVNEELPSSLQERSTYCIVGCCDAGVDPDGRKNGHDCFVNDRCCDIKLQNGRTIADDSIGVPDCVTKANVTFMLGEHKKECLPSINNFGNWIWLVSCSRKSPSLCSSWIPKFDHITLEGINHDNCVLHVITYDQPSFDSHHFSSTSWSNLYSVSASLKKPRWVSELHEEEEALSQMNLVFQALNCSTAAKDAYESSPPLAHQLKFRLLERLVALFMASTFCLYYILFKLCRGLVGFGSKFFFDAVLAKTFPFTWKILHIRCCQILHCPILLQEQTIRSHLNVEFAHKISLKRHSILSTVILDILVGNIVGFLLLLYEGAIYFWMTELMREISNNILRSGCVWLMGVPAGFKLNNELAAVFGMLSLNVIQIWSTVWVLLNLFYSNIIRSLAVSGIIFGVTVPAAFIIDVVKLATLHLSVLHWLFSHLYALQIQALASLWRLFRGRKWNPLRQRLDSYNYTVEQHVVGSLLFTPTFLLLPTTSVFFIFFSIMNNSCTFTCMIIEIIISMIYAIPSAEVFIWTLRPRRFPSGCWFEISPAHYSHEEPETILFSLQSSIASLGDVVLPHLEKAFSKASLSSGKLSAHGLFIGKSIPSALKICLPSAMPWISISVRDYWKLCLCLVFPNEQSQLF